MTFNIINSIIAFSISIMLSYGLWSIADSKTAILVTVGSFFYFLCTLTVSFAIKFENKRVGVGIALLSFIFFIFSLVLNFTFCFINSMNVTYILTSGISFMIYILIGNMIYKSE